MLISPPEKTKDQSQNSTGDSSISDEASRVECGTEISIDFSKIPVDNPCKTKKNITIQITSVDEHSILNSTEESINDTTASPLSKEKLIRLKIKMPKSPKGNLEIKRDRSFFTEKDFSTLPKEFIKFANSMICGDDQKRESYRPNLDAKSRYCDKSLNEERCGIDIEKEFGAISPIKEEPIVNITSSTPKKEMDEVVESPKERKKLEPLCFTPKYNKTNNIEQITEMDKEVCDKPDVVEFKPYEDIVGKLKPYSKYRMQYLHNLRKLQTKVCNKYNDQEFSNEPNPLNLSNPLEDLDENELLQLVDQSAKYHPVMGKHALLSKVAKQYKDDSEIVKELVTQKFSPFFERRRGRRENINNYSLPIDSITSEKEEKFQRINNNLNQTIHRVVVNEEVYAVINKNNKTKQQDSKLEERELKSNSKIENDLSLQDTELAKPGEFSAISDYDIEKFLQNAIGDVSLISQTMDTSRRSKPPGHYSEDHSIATGEMSLLVSKASSISTFCSTMWSRFLRKRSAIAPQAEDAVDQDEEQVRKEERDKRITLLKQEASVQQEIIRQASKALDYCEHLPGFDFLSQRVEAEKIILIATHKNKMIQHEIEDVTYYSTIRSTCSYLGSFAVRNLEFKVKDVCRKQDECSQWFVCVVSRGTETMASVAIQANEDGNLIFKEEFSFDYLSPDFEIGVSLFTLKVKKHKDPRSSFQRMKFFSFRREPNPSTSRKTLTSRFSRASLLRSPNKDYAVPIPIRQTSFLFLGETTITIKDVSKTNLILNNIANFANIFETVGASMTTSVNIDESFSDFLNIGTESGEKITWNRRWCALQNTVFQYWNSPSDEETEMPLKTINLAYTIKAVALADRSICPRARTLQLEIFIPLMSGEDNRHTIERYFLTSDTSESMHHWDKSLNSIISTMKAWNCLKFNGY